MKKIVMFAIGGIFLWSCNSPTETTQSAQEINSQEEHSHENNSEELVLNSGEKWQVNEEMKPFVQHGEELVNNYVPNDENDYDNLATKLKEQNDLLIKSCTMEGKSHDELHKWLYPHLELVERLASDADKAKAEHTLKDLQGSYQRYHEYFK